MSDAGEAALGFGILVFFLACAICILRCLWRAMCACCQERPQRPVRNNPAPTAQNAALQPDTRNNARRDEHHHGIEMPTNTARHHIDTDTLRTVTFEGNRRNPPINPSFLDIDHMPVLARIQVESGTMYADFGQGLLAPVEEEDCIICHEAYEQNELIWTSRNCQHIFHSHCIHRCMENGHDTCPICRTVLAND